MCVMYLFGAVFCFIIPFYFLFLFLRMGCLGQIWWMVFKILAGKKSLLAGANKLKYKVSLSCEGGLIPSPTHFVSPHTPYTFFLLHDSCVFDFWNFLQFTKCSPKWRTLERWSHFLCIVGRSLRPAGEFLLWTCPLPFSWTQGLW